MARPKKCRRICKEPDFDSFIPGGIPMDQVVDLLVDEYETLRLIDFEKLTQEECALKMNVARTTVTDMYERARYKLADAIVNGKKLVIEGGSYRLCGRRANCNGVRNCSFTEEEAGPVSIREKENNQMRIAVTYENGEIFQHFGHTKEFKVYDVEDGKLVGAQVVNTNGQGHGALAAFLFDGQVDALICGGIGGGAQQALAEAGIRLYGGVSGNADEAVQALLDEKLQFNPDVQCNHHGEGHSCGEHHEGHSCGHKEGHSCGGHSCDGN